MAFFRNIAPNSIEGVSLPVDGSNSVAVHFSWREPTYKEDRRFFLSLPGARLLETSGGCVIEFRDDDVYKILEVGKIYFNPDVVRQVDEKRACAEEDALWLRANSATLRDYVLGMSVKVNAIRK